MPTVTITDVPVAQIDAVTVAIGAVKGDDGVEVLGVGLDAADQALLTEQARALGMKAQPDEARQLPAPSHWVARSVVIVGLESASLTAHQLRYAAGTAARAAGKKEALGFAFPEEGPSQTAATLEGALLGAYSYPAPPSLSGETPPTTIDRIVVRGTLAEVDLRRAIESARAVWWVRHQVATPPNLLYPESLAAAVTEWAADYPVDVEIWDERRLETEGCGGILAVGSGSHRPPRLVVLRYRPAEPAGHLSLVGKGITFDSGGLSLKPAGSMVGMKYDMTGAATVAAATIAAAATGSPLAITAWLCIAENMPSGTALRPNDVITIRGGTTVEVLNTDAEGRLVLADGLRLASEEAPDLIVDVATLTGAARIALGERYAGLMGHEEGRQQVLNAADRAGELVWPMPLAEELRSLLSSEVATIANAKPGNTLGGMILGGLFLREFVGQLGTDKSESPRWAHLDIAGPASNSSGAYGYTPQGATGALTRTLIELASQPLNRKPASRRQ